MIVQEMAKTGQPRPDMPGMAAGEMIITYDEAEQLIRVKSTGLCTPEQADLHFINLQAAAGRMRRKIGHVRALVDLRDRPLQSPATLAKVQSGTESAFVEGDRVAVLLSSSLAKMQLKDHLSAHHQLFLSEHAALTWLRAFG